MALRKWALHLRTWSCSRPPPGNLRPRNSREGISGIFVAWYAFIGLGHLEFKHSHNEQGFTGRRLIGGTTIAGTMILANMAGIKIFATGGLGGVHRGGENSLDISADLTELGQTPITVISSGCKSFLDVPRTLEFLETQGVFVGTFSDGRPGKVDFPAFWTRESGNSSPVAIQDEKEAAAITCQLS